MTVARLALITLATLRATRFITSDSLGFWTLVSPAKAWADRAEDRAEKWRTSEYRARRAAFGQDPVPPPDGDDKPETWQSKLVQGLDCPFCVGFWIGAIILLGEVIIGRLPALRPLWTFGLGVFALNEVVGHVSSRIDG